MTATQSHHNQTAEKQNKKKILRAARDDTLYERETYSSTADFSSKSM